MTERSKKSSKADKLPVIERLLRWKTRVVSSRPTFALWTVLVLTCVAAGYTVSFLNFKTTRADLIDPNAPFHQRWLDYTDSFGDSTDMMVVVEAVDTGTIRSTLDQVADRLDREPELFVDVLYRLDTRAMRRKSLQYLSEAQLVSVRKRVNNYKSIWEKDRWNKVQLEEYVPLISRQLQTSNSARKTRSLIRQTIALSSSMYGFLGDQSQFLSPWPDILQVDARLKQSSGDYAYFLNDTGTMGFLKVKPVLAENRANQANLAITRLREIIADVNATLPADNAAQIGLTGIPVLEHDEMMRSQIDMLKAMALAFVLVGITLFVGFRGVRHPMLALLILIVGMAWTFGLTTFAIGHLNILSISFSVILIGLGIDFGIHYLSRYLQLRHEKVLMRPALEQTAASVGPGIVTSALTTSLAFGAAYFTDFLGVAELGMIAGGGVLLCAIATFFVMPALLSLTDKNIPAERLPTPMQGRVLRSVVNGSPMLVVAVSVLVIGAIGSQAFTYTDGQLTPRVKYDQNMLKLQAQDLESVAVQKRIFRDSRDSLLYAVSMAGSWEEAREMKAKFEALPTVSRVEDLASRLPDSPRPEAAKLIRLLEVELQALPNAVRQYGDSDPSQVGRELEQLQIQLADLRGIDPEAGKAALLIDMLLNKLNRLRDSHQVAFLTAYQNQMADSLLRQLHEMARSTSLEPIKAADLPDELKSRYVSADKRWLLQVYPREQVWDEEPLGRFVSDLRSVDPFITGTPVQNFEAASRIFNSYKTITLYALAVISLVLLLDFLRPGQKLLTLLPPLAIVGFIGYAIFQRTKDASGVGDINVNMLLCMYLCMVAFIGAVLDFRNLRDMLLAMLPPVLGAGMMFGILAMLKMDLNPANLIVLPLILGIGVDDGVHVIHDFRRQKGNEYEPSANTINAIVLTSVTSIIGFGSLMIASHQGLYSVGLVLSVGVACCLFVSLVFLPSVLTMVGIRQAALEESYVEDEEDIERELKRLEEEEKRATAKQGRRQRAA